MRSSFGIQMKLIFCDYISKSRNTNRFFEWTTMQLRKYFGRPYPWPSINSMPIIFLRKSATIETIKHHNVNKPTLNSIHQSNSTQIQRRSMMAAGAGQIKIIRRHIDTSKLYAQIKKLYSQANTDTALINKTSNLKSTWHRVFSVLHFVGSNCNGKTGPLL